MLWTSSWDALGPHSVGAADVSLYKSEQEHVTGRLFYPAEPTNGRQPWWASWMSPVTWIGHFTYAWGYANYVTYSMPSSLKRTLLRWALSPIIYLVGITHRLPVRFNAQMVTKSAGSHDNNGNGEATNNSKHDNANSQSAGGPPGSSSSSSSLRRGHPVILFSHGIAGTRNTYSSICTDLASMGYVVFAVEHSDGSASAVQRAPQPGQKSRSWQLYGGFGDKAAQLQKTQLRMQEMRVALQLVKTLNDGDPASTVHVSGLSSAASLRFKGQVDLTRVGLVGHSYGGATVAAAAAEFPEFGCAVALDPWWGALPPDSPALTSWRTKSPILIIGSHDWNTPTASGTLKCDGVKQTQLLKAAAAASGSDAGDGGGGGGGGAILLVPKGTSHHSFDDSLLLFGSRFNFLVSSVLKRGALTESQSPVTYHKLNVWSIDHFMRTSLPHGSEGLADSDALLHSAQGISTAEGGRATATAAPTPKEKGVVVVSSGVPVGVVEKHRAAFADAYGDVAAILQVHA